VQRKKELTEPKQTHLNKRKKYGGELYFEERTKLHAGKEICVH
jgi:hypothetical protein